MRRKHFDKELYAMYDAKAKEYTRNEFEDLHGGWVVEDHPLKTKVDLIVKKDDEIAFYVECEIKTALDKPFEYETLQLPQRKEKFCGLDKPTLFMLFSTDGSSYFCVWDRHVSGSTLAEVSNRYMKFGEYFFQIPVGNTDRRLADALKRLANETTDPRIEEHLRAADRTCCDSSCDPCEDGEEGGDSELSRKSLPGEPGSYVRGPSRSGKDPTA